MPHSPDRIDPAGAAECAGDCPIGPDRRAFLRQAGLAAAAALVALGSAPRAALAEPLRFITALRAAGTERTYQVPATDGAAIDSANDVVLVRWQGAVYALSLACPHRQVALRWMDGSPAEARFQCPKHKSRYQPDGTFIGGRATRDMDRFGIRRAGDGVVVDLGTLHEQPADPAAWAGAVVHLA